MPGRTVAEKMGVRAGSRALFVNEPDGVLEGLGLPQLDVAAALDGDFDHIHLFCVLQSEMRERFPALRAHLGANGKLWMSWPKGGRLGTDLSLPKVIEIGYDNGLVESTTLRVDDTWAGMKFTHPKPGKRYANSYGTLPGSD